MNGEIVYFELPGNDAARTQRFWGSLFGWKFNESNAPDYSMIAGSEPMGGMAHTTTSQHPQVFFSVEDIVAAIARVQELGGTAEEPVTIPSGSFATCTDDQGLQFSLFEAARS